jgi:hypothetical protein
MTTLEIKSTMPLTELLNSLDQLEADELDEVAATAVRLRASRRANVLPEHEAKLLEQISQTLTQVEQQRMNVLIDKRQAETLSEAELNELITLSDQVEEIQVERLSVLIELAAIRGVPLETLKKSLNFAPAA